MSELPKQTKRRVLIKRFRELGFEGPFFGTGPHPEFMSRGSLDVKLPNEHAGAIRAPLLKRILQSAGISEAEWLDGLR